MPTLFELAGSSINTASITSTLLNDDDDQVFALLTDAVIADNALMDDGDDDLVFAPQVKPVIAVSAIMSTGDDDLVFEVVVSSMTPEEESTEDSGRSIAYDLSGDDD